MKPRKELPKESVEIRDMALKALCEKMKGVIDLASLDAKTEDKRINLGHMNWLTGLLTQLEALTEWSRLKERIGALRKEFGPNTATKRTENKLTPDEFDQVKRLVDDILIEFKGNLPESGPQSPREEPLPQNEAIEKITAELNEKLTMALLKIDQLKEELKIRNHVQEDKKETPQNPLKTELVGAIQTIEGLKEKLTSYERRIETMEALLKETQKEGEKSESEPLDSKWWQYKRGGFEIAKFPLKRYMLLAQTREVQTRQEPSGETTVVRKGFRDPLGILTYLSENEVVPAKSNEFLPNEVIKAAMGVLSTARSL